MIRGVLCLALLTGLAACDDVMTSPAKVDQQAANIETQTQTPLAAIQVLPDASVNGGNFTVLGEISTSVGKATVFGKTPTYADGEQKLRIEAAELGADAVINASISDVTICALSWGCRNISGTAVKFSN